jgi:hypothetical protein
MPALSKWRGCWITIELPVRFDNVGRDQNNHTAVEIAELPKPQIAPRIFGQT